jgi:hypothetical protein
LPGINLLFVSPEHDIAALPPGPSVIRHLPAGIGRLGDVWA